MKKIHILTLFLVGWTATLCFAENLELTLTEREKQKLQSYFASDNSKLVWKGDPIAIELPLGKEKRIIFDHHVTVDLKGALTTDQLKVLNNDKSVYLTALQPFTKTRAYITDHTTNKVMLIDLNVSESASDVTQNIVIREHHSQSFANAKIQNAANGPENREEEVKTSAASYVDLIRFAWKQTYSPKNLVKNLPAHNRVPMKTHRFVTNLVYGDKVIAHPASSWMIQGNYVTVIFLQNKYHHSVSINLKRDICGHWLAASLYPRTYLKPHGIKSGDSTTLFLVSSKPFGETLRACYGDA